MKKEKMEKDERNAWIVVRSVCSLILFLFLLLGLVVKPAGAESEIDMEFVWQALHPASILNIIGVILWLVCLFGLTGLWSKLVPETLADKAAKWLPHAIIGTGALGAFLIFA